MFIRSRIEKISVFGGNNASYCSSKIITKSRNVGQVLGSESDGELF